MAGSNKSRDIEFTEEEINKYIDLLVGGGATKTIKIPGPVRKMIKEAIEQGKSPNKVLAAIKDAAPTVSGKKPVGEVLYPRGTPPPTLEDVEVLSRAAAILAGVFGASYLKNKSQEKSQGSSDSKTAGDESSFDMLSHLIDSKKKIDKETVDTIKKIAEVISPDKTVGEVLLAIHKKAPDTFSKSFDDAVSETDISRYKSADEVVGMFKEKPSPQGGSKKGKDKKEEKETAKKESDTGDYSPSDTAGVSVPEDTISEWVYTKAADTAGKRIAEKEEAPPSGKEESGKKKTSADGEAFNKEFEKAVSQEAGQPPAKKDTEMEERMKKLEQFVQSITGRKDES